MSSSALSSCKLPFTFPSGQIITNGWSGVHAQSGSSVTITNAAWNGTIGAGKSADIGFNASYSGTNTRPSAFALNGTGCTVS